METTISYADEAERDDIEELLSEYDLGISGDIGDYLVVKALGKVCASGKLLQMPGGCFHLEVLGVSNALRKTGLGGFLLSAMINDPQKYCRSAEAIPSGNYYITTIARGEAEAFYKKYGFKPCNYSILEPPYSTQCDDCPALATCAPVPMVYESMHQ
jgi:N-acetylglutamate synthase-like GNAT family acetyltransferase